MATIIKTQIVKIGNAQGVCIPKGLLEQARVQGEVELEVRNGQIIIRASRRPREGWSEQFSLMAERGDDQLLDSFIANDFDDGAWE